ncbi:hypothetical protein [uncultured Gimesia sp.]|uniref:hypothetical protein n=1 Tax=uncultured Gimesia sp. TaxID=1678688 RepID=UPI0030DD4871
MQPDPFQVLDEASAALRPDGIFLMQDIANSNQAELNLKNPLAPLLHTIFCMRNKARQNEASMEHISWGQEPACQTLEEVGFEKVEVHALPYDMFNYFYVASKPISSER